MAGTSDRRERAQQVWALTERQHGAVSLSQLLAFGYTPAAIAHRLNRGRLHPVMRGIYAVGRPELSRLGQMMAAVLACGAGAVVSHGTAAELWRLRRRELGPLHISVPGETRSRRPGIVVQRRVVLTPGTASRYEGVPVTSVALTLIDLAASLPAAQLERAVNMADSLELLDPERLRVTLDAFPFVPGVRALRKLLDAHSFRLTDSELERIFNLLVAQTSLPPPVTQRYVSGHRCDFAWPDLGLVVETDSLRYHRTPIQQRRDAERDHAHLLAGLERVRFTHFQVAYERAHVVRTLKAAADRARALRALDRRRDNVSGDPTAPSRDK